MNWDKFYKFIGVRKPEILKCWAKYAGGDNINLYLRSDDSLVTPSPVIWSKYLTPKEWNDLRNGLLIFIDAPKPG